MAIVYKHIGLDNNEVFYIGIGKELSRAYSKHSRSKFWADYVKCHRYTVEIVQENIEWGEAKSIEIKLILEYGRRNTKKGTLVNMTDGGEGQIGVIVSEATRKLHSMNNKGAKNCMYGKTHSAEARDKIRASKLRGKLSEANKLKLKESNVYKDKFGGEHPHSLQIYQYSKDYVLIETYGGIREAARLTKIDNGSIVKVAKGKAKTAGGYMWSYTILHSAEIAYLKQENDYLKQENDYLKQELVSLKIKVGLIINKLNI